MSCKTVTVVICWENVNIAQGQFRWDNLQSVLENEFCIGYGVGYSVVSLNVSLLSDLRGVLREGFVFRRRSDETKHVV